MADFAILCFAAFAAGALNALAGGGSFLTFPALIFTGVPAIPANATSAVAVFPGYLGGVFGFWRELKAFDARRLAVMIFLAVVGGVAGALLLLITPSAVFSAAVPWLLLFATMLFVLGGRISDRFARRGKDRRGWGATLLVCVYGGYFNGGLGIVLLALFSALGFRDLNLMNGLKNGLSLILSAASVITFGIAGIIRWPQAIGMMTAATVGGYFGAKFARRLPERFARRFIVAVGLTMTAIFFLH